MFALSWSHAESLQENLKGILSAASITTASNCDEMYAWAANLFLISMGTFCEYKCRVLMRLMQLEYVELRGSSCVKCIFSWKNVFLFDELGSDSFSLVLVEH